MPIRGLTRTDVIAIVVILFLSGALVLVALVITVRSDSLMERPKNCMNNFKQLGVSLSLYVDRFGSGRAYPAATGAAFWNVLRTVPTRATSMLPDNDGLFICKTKGGRPSPTRIDYTGPRASWFPPADEQQAANRIIAADLPTNHDPGGKGDINVLFFDGHVEKADYGSALWDQAARDTEP